MLKKKTLNSIIPCFVFLFVSVAIFTTSYLETYAVDADKGEDYYHEPSTLNSVEKQFLEDYKEVSYMFNIPIWVLLAISKQESNFDPTVQYNGAYGIMQLQKIDILSNSDLWEYHMDSGLKDEYQKAGFLFSTYEDMWNIYLSDYRAQIIAGAYIIRYYINYVLFEYSLVEKLDYTSNENINLINWSDDATDSFFKDILRRIFACYNGGPSYGMNVNLDSAYYDYPNKVYNYSMEYRNAINNHSFCIDEPIICKKIAS